MSPLFKPAHLSREDIEAGFGEVAEAGAEMEGRS